MNAALDPFRPLDVVEASDIAHVYVHYPFCERKCPYCDFNSHAGRDAEIDRYIDALTTEARGWRARTSVQTLFVGGGTPTHASAAALDRYLSGVIEALGASAIEELTIEANPGSLDREKIRVLKRAGVNRVSVGVQSFDDRHLRTLGRIHDGAEAVRAIRMLREEGMPRVSLDLILATPGQSLRDQSADLAQAVALEPDHISAYVLTYEEGTAFTRMMREGRLPAPEEERELDHLGLAVERLEDAGYRRYEISNFARPGEESRHNLAYWTYADWIGLGAGAHSHVGAWRWKNVDDPARYTDAIERGGAAVVEHQHIAAEDRLFEALMMGLRLIDGVCIDDVVARTGLDPRSRYPSQLAQFASMGLLRTFEGRVALTTSGLDVANAVIRSFLPQVVPSPTSTPSAR